jgi:hypothetical protein
MPYPRRMMLLLSCVKYDERWMVVGMRKLTCSCGRKSTGCERSCKFYSFTWFCAPLNLFPSVLSQKSENDLGMAEMELDKNAKVVTELTKKVKEEKRMR